MELLFSLVIIHGQMFRLFFFFLFFCFFCFAFLSFYGPLQYFAFKFNGFERTSARILQARQPFPSFFTVKIVFRYLIGSKWQLLYNKRVNNCQNGFFKLMKKTYQIKFSKTPHQFWQAVQSTFASPQDKSERTEKESNRRQILLPTKDTPKTYQRSCPCRFLHWKSIWEPSWIFSSRYYQLMNSATPVCNNGLKQCHLQIQKRR